MPNTDVLAELVNFQEALHQLHEELNHIRFLVATADATTRKLHQGLELMLQDLEASVNYSPEAPVTPTCPSVPWKNYSTEFEDDDNTSEKESKDGEKAVA